MRCADHVRIPFSHHRWIVMLTFELSVLTGRTLNARRNLFRLTEIPPRYCFKSESRSTNDRRTHPSRMRVIRLVVRQNLARRDTPPFTLTYRNNSTSVRPSSHPFNGVTSSLEAHAPDTDLLQDPLRTRDLIIKRGTSCEGSTTKCANLNNTSRDQFPLNLHFSR